MKREIMKRIKLSLYLPVTLALVSLAACSDDPETTNEEEVITTVTVALKTSPTDLNPVVLSWDDANLNAIVDEGEITTSGVLVIDKAYTASISLLNQDTDVTVEIEEEAKDHIFCFEADDVDITFSGFDTDSNGQRLGLTSTWTTGDASTGTVNIKLRHQPGFKTGDCPLPGDPAPGETDVDITFDLEIVGPL